MRSMMLATERLQHNAQDDDSMRALGFYSRDEAGPLAAWLVSDAAHDITGYHIGIDGPRIAVYDRVRTALEIFDADGWTVEKIESRLHGAIRDLPKQRTGWQQRNLPAGLAS
jgi:hypothetical protein